MGDWKQLHSDYLATPHWADLRQRCFQKANHQCEACRRKGSMTGHHLIYRTPLGSGTVEDIMCMCDRCHESWHAWLKENGRTLSEFNRQSTIAQMRTLIGNGAVRRKKKKKGKKNRQPSPVSPTTPKPRFDIQSRSKIDILETVVFEQAKIILSLGARLSALESKAA